MTTSQMELAKNRLFSKEGYDVDNVKLYPGTNRDVTPEEMAEALNVALSKLESGDYEELVIEE